MIPEERSYRGGWDSANLDLMAWRLGLAEGFLYWLLSLDKPDNEERPTLTEIINRARSILQKPGEEGGR